jgi:hypothetical protein
LEKSKLTPEILAGAFAAASRKDFKVNAAKLGERIAAENGCATAVEFIERVS